MLKKRKIKLLILLISIIVTSSYFFTSSVIGNNKFKNLESLLNIEQRQLIKKYIFPYKFISQQQQTISQQQQTINLSYTKLELSDKENDILIPTHKKTEKLFDDKSIEKYKLLFGFYSGINIDFPGSGWIDFYEDDIIVLSSRGVLVIKNISLI